MSSYVGPYRILRLINRGAQGSVYLGFDERLQRRVAIKIHELPEDRVSRRQLQREARLVAEMESPKIVQVHDVIESSRYLSMVMEYVPGCSLEDFLRLARPSLASVVTIGIDVAAALATARQHHVIHSDLKAANVLITEQGHAKLTDFGISRHAKRPLSLESAGSLSALSPEQYAGRELTYQSDLFSLGLLLYRMLGGEHPFYRNGKLDVQLLLHEREVPLKERVPAHLELPDILFDLMEELLRKNPRERPRNTVKVRQVLREVTRDIPLASQRSLLGEAQPYFRPEGPEDIATRIPAELGRDGRSRMPPRGGGLALLRYWWDGLHRRGRIAAAAVFGLLLLPLAVAVNLRVTKVRFEQPQLSYHATTSVPAGFSEHWLVQQVKDVVATREGSVRVLGEAGGASRQTILSNAGQLILAEEADQVFAITLRCLPQFCLLKLRRSQGEKFRTAQELLFPDANLEDWRQTVRAAALDLLRD